ncbi:glycosyltransferase family 4 protein [Rossellomorea vietnamensis]|uniref:glycosyltransferase family 4 protein n=1 Tax=Rossellomorea vietnamensis TaxID=218284 RepID=UPI001CCE6274|nr:glycosyltransferase family 4 protein [Rossellomorea vietnamensis]MCA0149770.1 glycosyltransferase family 4 protein [Rossellomorea vietnamensis]
MNVLMLTDKLTMGGAENYFIKLENKMNGEDVHLHTAAGEGELKEQISNKHNHLELSRTNHILNLWRLTGYIHKHKINVIHANSLRMVLYAEYLKFIVRKFNIKIIYTKHNITFLERFPKLFSALMNHGVARIITVSEYEKKVLTRYGVKEEIITTIYNGVDLETFTFEEKPKKNEFNVGILARLSKEKNHMLFLEIVASLKAERDIHFYIAGDGPERESIEGKIQELGIGDRVSLLGEVQKPHPFIQSMDALLLTSEREVFPMVIIEAMATGTPVISINKGGISEAIEDGETGMIVDQHSVKGFRDKIFSLKSDWELRKSIISAARRKVVRSFTSSQMVRDTLKLY